MKIRVDKAPKSAKCRGNNCKKLPEYINRKGRIRKDTSCAILSMDTSSGWATAFFCRSCIDQLYLDMKMALDPKLWIFK
jgi:hypothetical protein